MLRRITLSSLFTLLGIACASPSVPAPRTAAAAPRVAPAPRPAPVAEPAPIHAEGLAQVAVALSEACRRPVVVSPGLEEPSVSVTTNASDPRERCLEVGQALVASGFDVRVIDGALVVDAPTCDTDPSRCMVSAAQTPEGASEAIDAAPSGDAATPES